MKTYIVQGLIEGSVSVKQDTIEAKNSTAAIKKFLGKYPDISFINAKAKLANSTSIIQTKLFIE